MYHCRDCEHWEQEWYDEVTDEYRGYGCHRLNGETVNIGVCLLLSQGERVRLENTGACDNFQKRELVDEEIEKILFGDD